LLRIEGLNKNVPFEFSSKFDKFERILGLKRKAAFDALLPKLSAFITSQQFDVLPPMKKFDGSVSKLEPKLARLERNQRTFEL
jgi:hypothetical protein